MDSILLSIKKLLGAGPSAEETFFDKDLIVHINAAFMALMQMGVGPQNGFSISGSEEIWNDFMEDGAKLNAAKEYIYLKTKQFFDPPTSSAVADSTKRLCDEIEWRLTNMD